MDTAVHTYAGIGSRSTPPDILYAMEQIGAGLGRMGWVLRSGAADGADSAFERGCRSAEGQAEIFLPWPNFNGHTSQLNVISPAAMELACKFHPLGQRLRYKPPVLKLMARNAYQLLGYTLDAPAELVICWTPDGSHDGRGPGSGGTGQALRMASCYHVPVLNLADAGDLAKVRRMLDGAQIGG